MATSMCAPFQEIFLQKSDFQFDRISMEKIGVLSEIPGERLIEWKVKDFFSLRDEINTRYDSPNFQLFGISWNLRVYTNGATGIEGWIGLYLARMSSGSPITLEFSSILKSTDINKHHGKTSIAAVFDKVGIGRGYGKLILRSTLMERKADLAPSDEITIICILNTTAPVIFSPTATTEDNCVGTESHLDISVSVESLFKDFSELLHSGPNHDAEIKCGDYSIKVHKMILGARSEVLKAMLQSDMLEGRTGVVEIKDMEALHIQDFIKYLYTGSISEMNFSKAKALYEAGDKYAVSCLFLRCSKYLQNNLSPEIACQCLELAEAHSDQQLKNKVTTYILDEKVYLQDKHWSPFCENYPRLANEVYKLSHKITQIKNV